MTVLKKKTMKQLARERRAVRSLVRTVAVGMGSCLAINGHYYKRTKMIVHATNAEALRSDWQKIGQDSHNAMKSFQDRLNN